LVDLNLEDAIEDGTSFLENALIKAKHGSFHSGKYTIADDSGLVVPELDLEPGIFSARYAGDNASDKDNRHKIIQRLKELSVENLNAYYVCCLVGIQSYDDPMPLISFGRIYGKVSIYGSGGGGFGYDKIFYPENFDCSMASLDTNVKNNISHRAIAVKGFIDKFKNN
jgi:XTP/dITP diphosphohydrolase